MKKFLLVPFMLAAFAVGSIGSAIANDCGCSKSDMTKVEAKKGAHQSH